MQSPAFEVAGVGGASWLWPFDFDQLDAAEEAKEKQKGVIHAQAFHAWSAETFSRDAKPLMNIAVFLLSGRQLATVKVCPTDCIGGLRHAIADAGNEQVRAGFSIIGAGRVIKDDETVDAVGLYDGAVVTLIWKQPSMILTASADGTAAMFDSETGRCEQKFAGHIDEVNSAAFSCDGRKVVTASSDGSVRLFDVGSGEIELVHQVLSDGCVNMAGFSSDCCRLLLALSTGVAMIINIDTGICAASFVGHQGNVYSARFSADESKVLTASSDCTAKVFDTITSNCERTFWDHHGWVLSATFSTNGHSIVTSSLDGVVRCFDAKTGNLQRCFSGNGGGKRCAVFSPDCTKLLVANDDCSAKLFDIGTGRCEQVFTGHSGILWSAVFSKDGRKILTASSDGTAKLFSVETSECEQTFDWHSDMVRTAVFRMDTATL